MNSQYQPIPNLTLEQAIALNNLPYGSLPSYINSQVTGLLSAYQMSQQWDLEHPQPNPFKNKDSNAK